MIGAGLLLLHTDVTETHYFNPYACYYPHYGTGVGYNDYFGASVSVITVMIEGKLSSDCTLVYLTFRICSHWHSYTIYGFYISYRMGFRNRRHIGKSGKIIFYLINVFRSSFRSKPENIHSWFVLMATYGCSPPLLWIITGVQFQESILPKDSVSYLSIHAHRDYRFGFTDGDGCRLQVDSDVSDFQHTNDKTSTIFGLVNGGLISFFAIQNLRVNKLPVITSVGAWFWSADIVWPCIAKAYWCPYQKSVDGFRWKLNCFLVLQMLPILSISHHPGIFTIRWTCEYCLALWFCISSGWLRPLFWYDFKHSSSWNKVYHKKAYKGKTGLERNSSAKKLSCHVDYLSFRIFGFYCGRYF